VRRGFWNDAVELQHVAGSALVHISDGCHVGTGASLHGAALSLLSVCGPNHNGLL
jgi:hypothetical protein